jgi:hypothetical protein
MGRSQAERVLQTAGKDNPEFLLAAIIGSLRAIDEQLALPGTVILAYGCLDNSKQLVKGISVNHCVHTAALISHLDISTCQPHTFDNLLIAKITNLIKNPHGHHII